MRRWVDDLAPEVPDDLALSVLRLAATGCSVHQQRAALAEAPADAAAAVDYLLRRADALVGVDQAQILADRLLRAGARLLLVGFDGYPARLAQAWPELGAPLWLFARGGTLPDHATAAVVGTRKPTLDGIRVARDIAREVVNAGGVVVSGMARGIDQAAHRAALEEGGITAAVLGCGFGVDYPRGDAAIREAIARSGGLLTEMVPATPPRGHQFLERNRIVAALADVTVVVEGRKQSGALHTARMAAAQGREVMAVPGSLRSPASRGPLDLIADGATPVTKVEDVLDALHLVGRGRPTEPDPTATPRVQGLSALAASLQDLLGAVPVSPNALASAAGMPVHAVLIALAELAAAGLAERSPRGFVALS